MTRIGELPETTRMIARPCWERIVLRSVGQPIGLPDEDDIRDAIRVLREVHVEGHEGWWMAAMQLEAERILDEAGK